MGNRGSKFSAPERKTAEKKRNGRLNTSNSRIHAYNGRPKRLTFASRSARKTTDFNINLERIARIVNGIYVQKVLIDSDVSEEALAEILHMGPMTPEYLLALQENVVEEIMAAMKKTSAQFVKNTDATRIENRYANMHLAMSSGFDSNAFKNLSGKEEYATLLGNLDFSQVIMSALNDYITSIEDAIRILGSLSQMKSDDNENYAGNEQSELSTLFHKLKTIKTTAKNFQGNLPLLNQLTQLKEKSSFIQLLIEENKLRGYQEAKTVDASADDQSKANFDLFADIGSKLVQYADELTKLTGLAASLQSNRQTDAKYTAGLPNGVSDLGKLPADVEDKEFQKSANITQETSSLLRKALLPLDNLQANMEKVEEAWKPALGKIDSALRMIAQHLIMANQSKHAPARANDLKEMGECHENHPKSVTTGLDQIVPAITAINDLNGRIDKLSNADPAILLVHFDALIKVVEFDDNTTLKQLKKSTPGRVKKLKEMAEVAETIEHLKALLQHAQSLKSVVSLSGNLTAITDGLGDITTYHDAILNGNVMGWHGCLKEKVKDNGALVAEMLNAMKVIRSMAASGVDDTEGFMKTMMDSKSHLRSSQDDAKAMKGVKEPEPLSLKMFEQAEEATRNIGRAFKGIVEMWVTMEHRQKLGPLMRDFSFIAKALENNKKSLKPEDVAGLEEFLSLPQSLKDTFADFDQFQLSVDKLVLVNFDSIKLVLGDAAKVRSVKQDAKKMKKALEALVETVPSLKPQLDPIIAALDTLEPLALDFSSYKWNEAAVGMDYFYEFLRNYSSAVAAASTSNVGALVKKLISGSGDTNSYLIVGGCASVIIVVGGASIYLWRKSAAEKKRIQKELDDKDTEYATELANNLESVIGTSKNLVADSFSDSLVYGYPIYDNTGRRWADANPDAPVVENFPRERLRDSNWQVVERDVIRINREYLNGNKTTFSDRSVVRKYYCLQAPIRRKDEDIELHYKMMSKNGIELVVILRSREDTDVNFANFFPSPDPFVGEDDDEETKQRAAKTKKMTFGDCEVKLVKQVGAKEVAKLFPVDSDKHKMYKIEYTIEFITRSAEIVVASIWDGDKPPSSPKSVLQLLNYIRTYQVETNVAIMCPSGTERAATLISVRKYMEMSDRTTATSRDPKDFVRWMRSFRHNALKDPLNLWFAVMAGTKGAIDGSRREVFVDVYPKLAHIYKDLRDTTERKQAVLMQDVEQEKAAVAAAVQLACRNWYDARPHLAARRPQEEDEAGQEPMPNANHAPRADRRAIPDPMLQRQRAASPARPRPPSPDVGLRNPPRQHGAHRRQG